MKRFNIACILILIVSLMLTACSPGKPNDLDELQNIGSGLIMSADELLRFFESGEEAECELGANINLGDEMLTISQGDRSSLVIIGNGHTITSDAECLVRLDDGCSISLIDINLISGHDCIGGLGDISVYGEKLSINTVANGIRAAGSVTVLPQSDIKIISSNGYSIVGHSIILGEKSIVEAISENALHAICAEKTDLTIDVGARLSASGSSYSVLYTEEVLYMNDGATLSVSNAGIYHGAEIGKLKVDGVVTINASGGDQGVGVFIFELRENIYLLGSCTPQYRFDLGRGSLNFVESADDIPKPTPKPAIGPTTNPTTNP